MVLCWGSTPTLHPLELWFLERLHPNSTSTWVVVPRTS